MGVAGHSWWDAFASGILLAESDLTTSQLVKKKKKANLNNLTSEDALGPFSFSVKAYPLLGAQVPWVSQSPAGPHELHGRDWTMTHLREEAIH